MSLAASATRVHADSAAGVQTATVQKSRENAAPAYFHQTIAKELEQADQLFRRELDTQAPYVRDLIVHLDHYRGKRLRPTLLLLTAQACGAIRPEHIQLAAVVEMIHTATLVHDDVLDRADLRRHVATVNARWGNASSVLLGDMLFTHAFHLASKTGSALACQVIGEATNKVCEGELRQIGEQGNLDLSEADYYAILSGKTAALTACSCRLGAFFAHADSAIVEHLTAFGHQLGMAFQVADDVLDLMGNEKETGKSLGTDAQQQKLTLPLIHFLRQGGSGGRQARELLENPGPTTAGRLRQLLADSSSIRFAQREAERFIHQALAHLQHLPPSAARDVLDHVSTQIVHRSA